MYHNIPTSCLTRHARFTMDGICPSLQRNVACAGLLRSNKQSAGRWWKIAGATIGGGALLVLTGGLAAPAIVAGIGTIVGPSTFAAAHPTTPAPMSYRGLGPPDVQYTVLQTVAFPHSVGLHLCYCAATMTTCFPNTIVSPPPLVS